MVLMSTSCSELIGGLSGCRDETEKGPIAAGAGASGDTGTPPPPRTGQVVTEGPCEEEGVPRNAAMGEDRVRRPQRPRTRRAQRDTVLEVILGWQRVSIGRDFPRSHTDVLFVLLSPAFLFL